MEQVGKWKGSQGKNLHFPIAFTTKRKGKKGKGKKKKRKEKPRELIRNDEKGNEWTGERGGTDKRKNTSGGMINDGTKR